MESREPRFRLTALAGRLALIVFVVREIYVLPIVGRVFPPGIRFWVFLFHPAFTPRSLRYAFMTAVIGAIVGEILTHFFLRPMARFWLKPRVDHTAGLFRLAASEWMIEQTPARRLQGKRTWEPGMIVRTNQRVWFIPEAWDAETWSFRPDDLKAIRIPSPPFAFGLIDGFPDLIWVVLKIGETATFAVNDPETVLSWFCPELAAKVSDHAPDAA